MPSIILVPRFMVLPTGDPNNLSYLVIPLPMSTEAQGQSQYGKPTTPCVTNGQGAKAPKHRLSADDMVWEV